MSDLIKTFSGKAAIVTGGTRGIGRAICLELGRRGCNVAFNYAQSVEAANTLRDELTNLNVESFAAQVDVANTEAVGGFVKEIKNKFGRIDFLINNAGITRDNLILRMKEDDWDAVLDTNLKGAWNFSRAAIRFMLKQEAGGVILNITSISGTNGIAGQSNYSASKAGMIGLTKALAREVASRNVRVNALALGMIATDMTGALDDAYRAKILEQIPLGRFAQPEEIANIACFMASDAAAYITGQVIQIDGGMAM
ncbi:MAG: 3-oxoacyl-[acyl-carrier-protein] reductase [Pyrinomonadaceae bacterium MAG19_C2-C3]|nr:3-oxoacyl-[acyl-carrier-protein] reductase [Pyrinomonadaceae bacterium MAG19_C2-C3]